MSSSDPIGNRSLDHFDTIIIGSGAGGAPVAAVLTAAGQKVLVLEAGPNRFVGLDDPSPDKLRTTFANDELKLRQRDFIMPDPLAEPRTFRHKESDGVRTFVGDVNNLAKTVGGTAAHADVKTPRFEPTDFQLGTLLGDIPGASFADWPVTYDQLEPFYAYAEKALGVQGMAGADPNAGPRSGDYPMPPGPGMYGTLRLADGAKKINLNPFPYPTAVNSRNYDSRLACNDCGFCSGYGCPIHAKGSPAVTLLRRALLSGNCQLRPETRVVKLIPSAMGTSIAAVQVLGPDGKPDMVSADRFVLSASPIEDARLLLMSDPNGVGLGNSSGQVGRNLMFHFQTVGVGVFAERMHSHRGRAVTHAITDFRGKPNDANHPLGGIVELGASDLPISESLNYAGDLRAVGARLKSLLRQSPLRDHLMALTMQAEDAPQSTNVVDLDPAVRDLDGLPVPRITYQNHAFELTARQFYSPKLLDLLQAAGAQYVLIAPADDVASSRHVMGTLRFGSDAKTSVCDESGKFHDFDNLWAADGSLFPTSSGYNPILTIVTLALRVGGGIAYPGSPEKALST